MATVTVYDRRGRRLGTMYRGQMPEVYQRTLSEELTRMVAELLEEWAGCWPRLVYITDAGYHPTEYLAKLAQVLFDDPRAAHAWQRRMRHWLKCEPNAIFRIQHLAAKRRSELRLTGKRTNISTTKRHIWTTKPIVASDCRSAAASQRQPAKRFSRSASRSQVCPGESKEAP